MITHYSRYIVPIYIMLSSNFKANSTHQSTDEYQQNIESHIIVPRAVGRSDTRPISIIIFKPSITGATAAPGVSSRRAHFMMSVQTYFNVVNCVINALCSIIDLLHMCYIRVNSKGVSAREPDVTVTGRWEGS